MQNWALWIYSDDLAEAIGVTAVQVRKGFLASLRSAVTSAAAMSWLNSSTSLITNSARTNPGSHPGRRGNISRALFAVRRIFTGGIRLVRL
ncbi:MAG: hypothetical protein H6756_11770 [Candidatus Omnitrophica bacterium]|nr:hypothetical protein [Candidatus Omnitrophota bacterium]